MKIPIPAIAIALLSLATPAAAQSPTPHPYGVSVSIRTPDQLRPVISQSADAGLIQSRIYQPLADIDPGTMHWVPVLADSLPMILYDPTSNTTTYSYHIRKDARWDNGQEVSAADVVFSLKLIKCQALKQIYFRSFYDSVIDIRSYTDDKQKVTFICQGKKTASEPLCSQMLIIPQYIWDTAHAMDRFTIPDLDGSTPAVQSDPGIKAFADRYTAAESEQEAGLIIGSGAYRMDRLDHNTKILLTKKNQWWGERYAAVNYYFQAYPDTITYLMFNNESEKLAVFKSGKLDLADGFSYDVFEKEISTSSHIAAIARVYLPSTLAYSFFGINMNLDKFRDVRTRQAIAYLVDADKINKATYSGAGIRVRGPVITEYKDADSDLDPYDFDIAKASTLLREAGWKDTDHDSVLDKRIHGKKVDLTIEFGYNAGNESRRRSASVFKEDAAKAGIKVELAPYDWVGYIKRLDDHNFEMFSGAWLSHPGPWQPRQIFHTASTTGGSNSCGFGDDQSDKLIDSIMTELDTEKRIGMYKKLQRSINEQVPYVFLYTIPGKLVASKRLAGIRTIPTYPCYNPATFRLAE